METPSAVTTPESAANALPHHSARKLRLTFTESDAAKFGFLDRWQATLQRRADRKAKLESMVDRFQAALTQLILAAEEKFAREKPGKKFTGRKLASMVQIPDRTLRRLRGANDLKTVRRWMPAIEAALRRLKAG